MAQTSDPNRDTPSEADHSIDRSRDADFEIQPDAQDDDVWAPSSWDLRQGLDVAELAELPAEWPGNKPN